MTQLQINHKLIRTIQSSWGHQVPLPVLLINQLFSTGFLYYDSTGMRNESSQIGRKYLAFLRIHHISIDCSVLTRDTRSNIQLAANHPCLLASVLDSCTYHRGYWYSLNTSESCYDFTHWLENYTHEEVIGKLEHFIGLCVTVSGSASHLYQLQTSDSSPTCKM